MEFFKDRNKLMMFLFVVIVVLFYLFFIFNMQAQKTITSNNPNMPTAKSHLQSRINNTNLEVNSTESMMIISMTNPNNDSALSWSKPHLKVKYDKKWYKSRFHKINLASPCRGIQSYCLIFLWWVLNIFMDNSKTRIGGSLIAFGIYP